MESILKILSVTENQEEIPMESILKIFDADSAGRF